MHEKKKKNFLYIKGIRKYLQIINKYIYIYIYINKKKITIQ